MTSESRLTAPERQVLGALMMQNAGPADKTVESVAQLTGLTTGEVRNTLRQMESEDPPLVHRLEDDGLNIEFWIAQLAAIEALEAEGTDALSGEQPE